MKNWAAHKWQNTNTFLMNIEIAIMRETIMHRNSPFIPCFFQVVIFMQRKSEKWGLCTGPMFMKPTLGIAISQTTAILQILSQNNSPHPYFLHVE